MILLICCLAVVTLTHCDACTQEYTRFHPQHTFCKDPNPRCRIIANMTSSGNYIREILVIHNSYRSLVARGQQIRDTRLPIASNMLQMEWDVELATIAQRHANQCALEHDCNECRMVGSFSVGQNLYHTTHTCPSGKCEPNWKEAIDSWYNNEINSFDKNQISSFTHTGPWGQLTQILWAKTWRIGCGYVQYKENFKNKEIYVCNYGPAGNVPGEPVYKIKDPCSECPGQTCCGKSCKYKESVFPGLCKVLNIGTGPNYHSLQYGLDKYRCDFRDDNEFCMREDTSQGHVQESLTGNYLTITLTSGQSHTLKFLKSFKPEQDHFCLAVVYRKGPTIAGNKDQSTLTVSIGKAGNSLDLRLGRTEKSFARWSVNPAWQDETSVSFSFSVPEQSYPHFLDIKLLTFYDGECVSNMN